MSWYDEMVAAGRSKSLTTGNVRCGVAAVHGSPALDTPMNCHSELMEDPLRNIQPVQLGVEQMCEASVELPSITDVTGCGVQSPSLATDTRITRYQPNCMSDASKTGTRFLLLVF